MAGVSRHQRRYSARWHAGRAAAIAATCTPAVAAWAAAWVWIR